MQESRKEKDRNTPLPKTTAKNVHQIGEWHKSEKACTQDPADNEDGSNKMKNIDCNSTIQG